MKKFLSLVLALVMTMSLVTISAGAKDFADDSDIDYKEAVDVISALGIVDGYSDSSFRPDGSLTRGAAAKIICNLILGPTTASALSATTAPFKDVPTTNVFAGYITYCAQQGIISGYGDGTFRPTGSLTGNAFMKMLLGALGYDSTIEGYTGSNWQVNVTKQAIGIGLDDGNNDFVGTRTVTRQEACLYAFNMLQATMVEYSNKTTVEVNGATVTIAGDKAQDKSWGTGTNNDGNIDKDGFVQFAEQYFDKLKLTDDGADDFGRPANIWTWKGDEIGTYPKTADATYTAKVEVGEIYKDLGLSKTVNASDVTVYVNGVKDKDFAPSYDIKKGDDDHKYGANGVLTEAFYDEDTGSVIITLVETYVGTVARTVAARGNRDAYVVIATEYTSTNPNSRPDGIGGTVEFETDDTFEDDAYVLYTYSDRTEEVKSLAAAELVSGTATRTENDKIDLDANKAITIGDTKYSASRTVAGEDIGEVSVGSEYDVYLDQYGYAIYIEESELLISSYALVRDAANRGSFVGNKADMVFTDGKTDIVDTDVDYTLAKNNDGKFGMSDTYQTIVTFKVDDNGEYTLKPVRASKDGDVEYKTVRAEGIYDFELINDKAGIVVGDKTVTANSATTFVVCTDVADDEWTVYTGIKNAPSIHAGDNDTPANGVDADEYVDVYYYCKSGSMVTVMFIVPGPGVEVEDDSNSYLYLAGKSVSNLVHDEDGDYFIYKGSDNGEIKEIKIADTVTVGGKDAGNLNGLYRSYTMKDGIITALKSYVPFDSNDAANANELRYIHAGTGIDKVSKEYTVILDTAKTYEDPDDNAKNGPFTITVDEDADIFYVDKNGNVTESSYNGIAVDENDKVYAVINDYMVQTLVIQEVPKGTTSGGSQGANWKAEVTDVNANNGRFTVNFTYDRPDYMVEGTPVKLTFNVYENGYETISGLTATVPAGRDTVTFRSNIGDVVDPESTNVTVEVTNEMPAEVKVLYVLDSDDITSTAASYLTGTKTEKMATGTPALSNLSFTVDGKYSGTIGYTISGLSATSTTGTDLDGSITAGTAEANGTTDRISAAGDDYVKVVFTGLNTATEMVKVTLPTLAGYNFTTIPAAAGNGTGVAAGTPVAIQVEATGDPTDSSTNYGKEITVEGVGTVCLTTGSTPVTIGSTFNATNLDLTGKATVENVAKMAAPTAVVNGQVLELTFVRPVAADAQFDTASTTAVLGNVTVEGNVVKIQFAGSFTSGDTVLANGAIKDAVYTGNTIADDTTVYTAP